MSPNLGRESEIQVRALGGSEPETLQLAGSALTTEQLARPDVL